MAKRELWIGKRKNWCDESLGQMYEMGYGEFNPIRGFAFQIDVFCAKEFESITGLKLKLGEVRKIKRIVIELEKP
jgi:hypothetical protein